ncbi:hypothetical protein AB0425_30990 [Actinosynnema sp. NPDC051121]
MAWTSLAEALTSQGRQSEAVDIAGSLITDLRARCSVLAGVAESLLRAGRHEEAVRVLERATEVARFDLVEWRIGAWASVAEASAVEAHEAHEELSMRLFEQAARSARSIVAPDRRNSALMTVAKALAGAGHHDQATAVTELITDPYVRCLVLATAAGTPARTNQPDRAIEVVVRMFGAIRDISAPERMGWVLAHLAKALMSTGRVPQASRVFELALEAANRVTGLSRKSWVLASVAEALADSGHHDQAFEVANSAWDPYWRDHALGSVVRAMARAGHHDQAVIVADLIANPGERLHVLVSVAEALTGSGYRDRAVQVFEWATELARSDAELGEANEASVTALAGAGHHDQAVEAAQSISDPGDKARALLAVAKMSTGAGTKIVLPAD